MPSSTPAGTLTVSVRRARTRPSPEHSPQGCSMIDPSPEQRGQVRVVMTWPRKDRCTCCTSPRPRQVSQVIGYVPEAVPAPVHVPHTTAVSSVSSRSAPNAVSASSHSRRSSASAPWRARLRGPRWLPLVPPKNASMMSPSPPKPCAKGLPCEPGPLDSGSPPRSTTWRFCGSESTSYAAVTALNCSCASGSGLTSGCSVRASLRYAFFSSSSVASCATPRTP